MKNTRRVTIPKLAIGILCLVLGLWFGWFGYLGGKDSQDAAWKGDAFGPLNTLFAGLAFGGALLALYKQHLDAKDQELQRREDKAEEAANREREEERRREDREREKLWQAEAEARHREALEAQERIARLQALAPCLNQAQRDYDYTLEEVRALHGLRALADALLTPWRGNHDNFHELLERYLKGDGYELAKLIALHAGPLESKTTSEVMAMLETEVPRRIKALEAQESSQSMKLLKIHAEISKVTGLSGLGYLPDSGSSNKRSKNGRTARASSPSEPKADPAS